jgi:hypothetical protein
MDDLFEIDKNTYIRPSEVMSISESDNIDLPYLNVINLKNGTKVYTNTTAKAVYYKLAGR